MRNIIHIAERIREDLIELLLSEHAEQTNKFERQMRRFQRKLVIKFGREESL